METTTVPGTTLPAVAHMSTIRLQREGSEEGGEASTAATPLFSRPTTQKRENQGKPMTRPAGLDGWPEETETAPTKW